MCCGEQPDVSVDSDLVDRPWLRDRQERKVELASYLRIEERELGPAVLSTAQRRTLANKPGEDESAGKSSV
jgi:hypothetical protein